MRLITCSATALLALFALATPATAQVQLGPQLTFASDSDLGIGARLTFPLRRTIAGLHGLIEGNYYPSGEAGIDNWVEANLNLRLPVPISDAFDLLLGGGLNFSFISLESSGSATTDTSTHVGINVLGAIEVPRGPVVPFLEFRSVLTGAEQVMLTAGVLFGARR